MKKNKIIILFILLIIMIIITLIVFNCNKKQRKSSKEIGIIKEEFKKEEIEYEQSTKPSINIRKDNIQNNRNSNNDNINTTKNNKKTDNNAKSNVVEEKTNIISNNSETVITNDYIGIPDPNNPFYTYHHGIIEYSSMEECLNKSEEISFKDTIDILNTLCVDVVDSNGTILGEYLYINCSSGNCNKYKQ